MKGLLSPGGWSAAHRHPRVRFAIKRLVDVIAGVLGLAVLALPVAAVSAAIGLTLREPAIYPSRRAGLHGHPFTIYKLRTMTSQRDPSGRLLPDADRISRFGKYLRALSLDEIPQLFNVVKGDMSLVGPRPLPIRYLDRYTASQARRHLMKPGITGLAQVNGRNAIRWEDKFRLDVWYVDHWSLTLDATILLRTIGAVVSRVGVSAKGFETMPEFNQKKREPPSDEEHG